MATKFEQTNSASKALGSAIYEIEQLIPLITDEGDKDELRELIDELTEMDRKIYFDIGGMS